jgi:hypothetical protein
MVKSFTAQLKGFADKTDRRALAVARESIQDVMDDAQTTTDEGGRMPVKTGFLRNSVASGLNGSGNFAPRKKPKDYSGGADNGAYLLTLAGMELGDVVRFAWTAEYAIHQELGAQGRTGKHFVGVAAAKWPQFVDANAARVR